MPPVTTNDVNKFWESLFATANLMVKPFQHPFVQGMLQDFFSKCGFAVKEKSVGFTCVARTQSRDGKRLVGTERRRRGLLDFFAIIPGAVSIAIEFDSGRRLKWKSTEKLLQCPSNVCIGLANGKIGEDNKKGENIARIQQVWRETQQRREAKDQIDKFEALEAKLFWFIALKPISIWRVEPTYAREEAREDFMRKFEALLY